MLLYVALLASLAVSFFVPQEALTGSPSRIALRGGDTHLRLPQSSLQTLSSPNASRMSVPSPRPSVQICSGRSSAESSRYLSLITGFRFLLVVVAVLYALAFAFGRRHIATRFYDSGHQRKDFVVPKPPVLYASQEVYDCSDV